MELQVQELLERIKTEGVDTAKKEAQAILDAAKTKADSIVASPKPRLRNWMRRPSSRSKPRKTLPDSPSSRHPGTVFWRYGKRSSFSCGKP